MNLRKITESIVIALARLIALTLLPIVAIKYIGDEAYGIVAFLLGWITLIVMVAPIGHDNLLLRNTQRYLVNNDTNKLVGLRNQSYITTSLFSIVALLVLTYILIFHKYVSQISLIYIVLFLPLMSLTYLSSFVIQGIGKTTIASTIRGPGPMVAIILLLYFFNRNNWNLINGIDSFFGLYALVYSVITPFVFYYAIRLTKCHSGHNAKANYDTIHWMKDGSWLLMFSLSFIVLQQIDILMIGSILGTNEIGSYQVASKLATLLTVGLLAVNIYIPPMISKLYAERDSVALQRIFQFSVSGSILVLIVIPDYV
jgi:O-antigen/teichoic acid export membrane protein